MTQMVKGGCPQRPREPCPGSCAYLESPPHHLASQAGLTSISPLVHAGSDHCSSKAWPPSSCPTVKLLSPLGEDSRVRTGVQGLETFPAWLAATMATWYVVKGSNPNRWASRCVPCKKIYRLGFPWRLRTTAGETFSEIHQ